MSSLDDRQGAFSRWRYPVQYTYVNTETLEKTGETCPKKRKSRRHFPGNIRRFPGNIFHFPGDASRFPGYAPGFHVKFFRIPGGDFHFPGNGFRIPDDIFHFPGYGFYFPENGFCFPGNGLCFPENGLCFPKAFFTDEPYFARPGTPFDNPALRLYGVERVTPPAYSVRPFL
jgi:hypothetical protein